MAQKDRDTEFWLIPKRANLHQTVVLLKWIIELGYDGKTWNGAKQDRLGSFLAKSGATDSGKTITPQSIRTLVASIPQYFGFLFINQDTTPNTLHITESGKKLVEENIAFLEEYKYTSLKAAVQDKGDLNYSNVYLRQFEKLQITNPVILKDCENIFLFPLSFVLKVIRKTEYLTLQEIAYFIFRCKNQDQIDLVVLEILNFREISYSNRTKLIDLYKETHLGNISLVKAPSSKYFEKLCRYTDLFKLVSFVIPNPGNNKNEKSASLIINTNKNSEIDAIISIDKKPYDFKNNLKLWIQYIGNLNINNTPIDIDVINKSNSSLLIIVNENGHLITGDLLEPNKFITFPYLETLNYSIKIYDIESSNLLDNITFEYSGKSILEIDYKGLPIHKKEEFADIKNNIIEHLSSKNFTPEYTQYLKLIGSILNKDFTNNKSLRGSVLEFLTFKLFKTLENKNIVDEVIWNGKIGDYGKPSQAPGGPTGSPDMFVFIDDIIVVLELTTIKPKAMQWSAEGASVPDHIKIVERNFPLKKVYAFYLAPILHSRITSGMHSNMNDSNAILISKVIETFLNDLEILKDKKGFIDYLENQ